MILARFIYKYFYIFFKVNLKMYEKGTAKDAPWILALIEVTAGIGFILLDIFSGMILLTGSLEYVKQMNRILFVFWVVAPSFIVCYYLLFVYLKVSKTTGKTEKIEYEPERSSTIFYYALAIITGLLPLLLALMIHRII